jgi:anthranilate synthase component 1
VQGRVVTVEDGECGRIVTDKPLDVLRGLLSRYKAPRLPGLPPFTGGFVGYFEYSMLGYAEPVLKLRKGDGNDFDLMLFDKVIAYDHLKQKICLIVNIGTDRLMENYGRAAAELEAMARLITAPQDPDPDVPGPPGRGVRPAEFVCSVSKETYCRQVEKTKDYIVDGDIFQAVISRRFESPFEGSLLDAYRVLRTTNPSPYMVFMRIDGLELMSASPETLVRLQNGRLATFPVAGSRPRGGTEEEDDALEKELLLTKRSSRSTICWWTWRATIWGASRTTRPLR